MDSKDYLVPTPKATPENTAGQRAAMEIRGIMAARKFTAVDLAAVIGVAPATAARRVNGLSPFDINELEAVAKWLDVPVERIIAPTKGMAFSK